MFEGRKRRSPTGWLLNVAAFFAAITIGLTGGCGNSAEPEADSGLPAADVGSDSSSISGGALALEHGRFVVGGTPMMSNRFELVGIVSVTGHRATSARFTLEGGL